jgi:hypothetical protein
MPFRTFLACILVPLSGVHLFAKDQVIDDGLPTVPGKEPVLSMNLIGFDASTGELRARHNLRLPTDDVDLLNDSPKQNYYLVDPFDINTPTILAIKSDVPYSLYDNFLTSTYQVDDAGSQFLYPFDTHHTRIRLFVTRQDGTASGGKPLRNHLRFLFSPHVPTFEGYDVRIIPTGQNSPTLLDLTVELKRTLPIRCYSVFIAVLMLLISISVFRMALKRMKSSGPPEMSEMAFCAALLFAFPAIRNAQPFAPPMGVLSDYLGFFWAESIVAVTLLIKLNMWLRRKKHD